MSAHRLLRSLWILWISIYVFSGVNSVKADDGPKDQVRSDIDVGAGYYSSESHGGLWVEFKWMKNGLEKTRRVFVKSKIALDLSSGQISYLDLELRPLEVLTGCDPSGMNCDAVIDGVHVNLFPVSVQRNIDIGLGGAYNIHALGVTVEAQSDPFFINGALDLIGLSWVTLTEEAKRSLSNDGYFGDRVFGLSWLTGSAEAGIEFPISGSTHLQFAIGGSGNFTTLGSCYELYSRITLLLNDFLAINVQGGVREFMQRRNEPIHTYDYSDQEYYFRIDLGFALDFILGLFK